MSEFLYCFIIILTVSQTTLLTLGALIHFLIICRETDNNWVRLRASSHQSEIITRLCLNQTSKHYPYKIIESF